MDKIKINNQIISMRKYVKQAKVRIINKLVKDSKSLQLKHGSELQLQKYKRKTDRILAEIEVIKKLNVDVVSKAALTKEKNWEEILASKTSDTQERAFALVANFTAVQSEVEAFHTKNSNLVPLVSILVKEWEEKKAICSAMPSRNVKASEIKQKKKEKKFRQRYEPLPKGKRFKTGLSDFPPDDRFTFQKTPECEEGSKTNAENQRIHKMSEGNSDMETSEFQAESAHEPDAPFTPADGIVIKAVDSSKLKEQSSELELDNLGDKDTTPIDGTSDPEEATNETVGKSLDSSARALKEPLFASEVNKQKLVAHLKLDNLHAEDRIPTSGAPEPEAVSNKTDNKSIDLFSRELKEQSSASKVNRQKVVAHLNLDDLDGKDTIPIEGTSDPEEEALREGNDNKPIRQDLKNDPFFVSGDEPLNEDSDQNMSASDSESFQESRSSWNRRNDSGNFRGQNDSRNFRGRSNSRNFRGRNDSRSFRGRNDSRSFRGRNDSRSFRGGNDSARGRGFLQKGKFHRDSQSLSKSLPLPGRSFGNQPFERRGPKSFTRNQPSNEFSRNSKTNQSNLSQTFERRNPNFVSVGRDDKSKDSSSSTKQSGSSLHPSWEAKKKQKMKEMKIAPFQGTKIKFE